MLKKILWDPGAGKMLIMAECQFFFAAGSRSHERLMLGSRKQINPKGLRRILVRLQGAPRGAYCRYVPFGATPKADQKTSKRADLFVSEALKSMTFIIDLLLFHTTCPGFTSNLNPWFVISEGKAPEHRTI